MDNTLLVIQNAQGGNVTTSLLVAEVFGKAKNAYTPIQPEEVSLREVQDGSLEIGLDGIFITGEDGVRRQVFLYKRSYFLAEHGKPRFHICKCRTIESFMQGEDIPAYRRANTSKVIVLNLNTEKDVWVDNLPLCKNCARIIGNVNRNMDSAAFVDVLKAAAPAEEEHTQQSYEIDARGYTRDWNEISRRFREEHNYTCEKCGVQVSRFETEYIHVHHRNGDKANNRRSNLQCLCIKCHSEVDPTHVRNFSSRPKQTLIKLFMQNYAEKRFVNNSK